MSSCGGSCIPRDLGYRECHPRTSPVPKQGLGDRGIRGPTTSGFSSPGTPGCGSACPSPGLRDSGTVGTLRDVQGVAGELIPDP